jgi:hypothetical protein
VNFGGQWLEIFRAGDYGDKGKYTAADLQAMASSYDPKVHEAPVTIGHPEMNAPAFGWVEKLQVSGGTLLAKLRQVQPSFEDMVRRGSFKKRSVGFYRDGSSLRLRHLAFLGGQPPEVKGLADPQFAQFGESSAAVFDFEHVPARGLQQEGSSMKFNSCGGSIGFDVRSGAICEAAKERAAERDITFAEGLRQINEEDAAAAALRSARGVDPASIAFMEAAQRRAAADGIEYGDALRLVYAENSGAPGFMRADGAMRQILVAAIQDGQVILNAGAAAGLKVGDRLSVQRLDREITDPASSKQVIRRTFLPLGTLTITKLDDVSADAKGANVGQLKVGDVCTVVTA